MTQIRYPKTSNQREAQRYSAGTEIMSRGMVAAERINSESATEVIKEVK